MAKLTITFKGIPLNYVNLQGEQTRIGRDPANEVHIDSLAIADFHAVVLATPDGYLIRRLQDGFPVNVNRKPVAEAILHDGDDILIGKHVLYFSEPDRVSAFPAKPPAKKPEEDFRHFEASLQVLNGSRIGMVIPLKATITQIGKDESGIVLVSRDDDGYSLSPTGDKVLLTVNGRRIEKGETQRLASGDMIRINNSLLQYFQE